MPSERCEGCGSSTTGFVTHRANCPIAHPPKQPCVCGCVSLWGHWQHLPDCPWLKAQPAKFQDGSVASVGGAGFTKTVRKAGEIDAREFSRSILSAARPAAKRYFQVVLETNDGRRLDNEADRAAILDELLALFS